MKVNDIGSQHAAYYPNVNSAIYGYCKELLEKTMRRREESSINNETLEDAISELHKHLPTYK